MYKANILEQAIKEIKGTWNLDQKLNIETQGFSFECFGREYTIFFSMLFGKLCVEIENEEETLFARCFKTDNTFNDIVEWLEQEKQTNKDFESFNFIVDYDAKDKTLWLGNEDGSGAEYKVIDKDTFLSAVERYFDIYIAQ